MRKTKRIAKLLEGATLRDKFKILADDNSYRMQQNKPLYTDSEIKAVKEDIYKSGQNAEFEELLTLVNVIIARRGEFYFENLRLVHLSLFSGYFYNNLIGYAMRLGANNVLINGLGDVGARAYEDEKERALAQGIGRLIDNFCQSLTDDPLEEGSSLYPYRIVRDGSGQLRLHGATLWGYLVGASKGYLMGVTSAKETYDEYKSYVTGHDIEELIPGDIANLFELLKRDRIKTLRIQKKYEFWRGLVDRDPVEGLEPGGEYSILDYFGVGHLFPTLSEAKTGVEPVGDNNRFERDLKAIL